ncbi:MAG: cytochrome c oxidase subunit 3 [Planctomycetes bacterium]|nr:cytochrome c oxidase subunit 3 [Planctomycetota bacterium]
MAEALAVHAPTHGAEDAHRAKLAMWLFLASEVMFFSGFIAAYIVLRNATPAGQNNPFNIENRHLSVPLATVNTMALILSSFTMALAVAAGQRGDKAKTSMYLICTILLGTLFLGIKGVEYGTKFSHHIFPSTNVFYGCYFVLTGFHGLHVLIGVLALFILAVGNERAVLRDMHSGGNTPMANPCAIECTGLYWHLVDIVWIFLFPLLYLL